MWCVFHMSMSLRHLTPSGMMACLIIVLTYVTEVGYGAQNKPIFGMHTYDWKRDVKMVPNTRWYPSGGLLISFKINLAFIEDLIFQLEVSDFCIHFTPCVHYGHHPSI